MSTNSPKARRELRQRLGLSQVEFASLVGVHPVTVSRWELNKAQPTHWQRDLLDAIQEAYIPPGTDLGWLMGKYGSFEILLRILKGVW